LRPIWLSNEILEGVRYLDVTRRDPALQLVGDILAGFARPAFGRIEGDHAQYLAVLATDQVVDDR
jgi:hypothetical protein